MVSTDAGPNRERIVAGVIADVSWKRFETLCGVPARMGRCPGSWTVATGPRVTLPPTSTTPLAAGGHAMDTIEAAIEARRARIEELARIDDGGDTHAESNRLFAEQRGLEAVRETGHD